jgi:hypothetical protein
MKTVQPRAYMGTTWHSSWCRLSEALGIRLDGNVSIGCSQHHKVQEGYLGGLVGANTFGETLAGMLQAR